jgi:trk system potassium uptake protein TrkA
VTSGDNSNILVARVARELYGAQRVVARIYDPRRAAVYERLGIATIATVTWTTMRILRLIEPRHGRVEWTDPTSTHVLAERRVASRLAGASIANIEDAGVRLVLVSRNGRAQLPDPSVLLQEGDTIHLLASIDSLEAFDAREGTETEAQR